LLLYSPIILGLFARIPITKAGPRRIITKSESKFNTTFPNISFGTSKVTNSAGTLSIKYNLYDLFLGIPRASAVPHALPRDITTKARKPAPSKPNPKK
jgi:hypothetical protein